MTTTNEEVVRRRDLLAHPTKRILFIVSNTAELHGFPVSFFAEELTRPFFDFVQAGYEVELRSPNGGRVEFDAFSDPANAEGAAPNDLISLGFREHRVFGAMMDDTPSIDDVDVAAYDAVCVAGGGGPLVTFQDDARLHRLIAEFHESGKVVGLICHGSCLLLWTTLSDGTLLADGKTWTGFPDSEEEAINAAAGMVVNDYTIETEALKNPNTTFESAGPFEPFAVRDGRLITAQQQNSTGLFSELVIATLDEMHAEQEVAA